MNLNKQLNKIAPGLYLAPQKKCFSTISITAPEQEAEEQPVVIYLKI